MNTPGFETEAPRPEQFNILSGSLEKIMGWSGDYFTSKRKTALVVELADAKKRLEAGELKGQPAKVKVYEGTDRKTVEDLFNYFSSQAGTYASDYRDLEAQVADLYHNQQIWSEGAEYSDLVIGDKLALVEGNAPSGILLKLSENILSEFHLGGFGDNENRLGIKSTVNLVIADIDS
jgi:hypothetical protein